MIRLVLLAGLLAVGACSFSGPPLPSQEHKDNNASDQIGAPGDFAP